MSVTEKPGISIQSMVIKPPSHPTYDLQGVIKLALAEDAGDRGSIRICLFISRDSYLDQCVITLATPG